MLEHVRDESDVKFRASEEKPDELQVRFLELEERLEIAKDKPKSISAEHAEYEEVIRRSGGMTIAEVKVKALEIAAQCANYRSVYGRDSW